MLTHHTLGFSNKYLCWQTWGPCTKQWNALPAHSLLTPDQGMREDREWNFNCISTLGTRELVLFVFPVWVAAQTEVDRLSLCIFALRGGSRRAPTCPLSLVGTPGWESEELVWALWLQGSWARVALGADLHPALIAWSSLGIPNLFALHSSFKLFSSLNSFSKNKTGTIGFVSFSSWYFWLHHTYQVPCSVWPSEGFLAYLLGICNWKIVSFE